MRRRARPWGCFAWSSQRSMPEPARDEGLNPALGYNAFDELLQKLAPGVRAATPAVLGYPAHEVAERLLQRLVELGLHPSLRAAARRHRQGLDPLSGTEAGESWGGLVFEATGVRPTLRARLRACAEFFAQWLRAFWIMTRAAAAPRREQLDLPATIVLGVGGEDLLVDGSDQRFVDFVRRGPLEPLTNARHLIVEKAVPQRSTAPDLVTYARYPVFETVRLRRPGMAALARFAVDQARAAAVFLRVVFTRPLT